MKKDSFQTTVNTVAEPASQASPVTAIIRRYRWVIVWCLFHVCALFLSYREIPIFNATGEPKTEKFWPFVKFTYPYFIPDNNETYSTFNGFFTQYDWTEFVFYVGGVLIGILIVHVYRKSQ